MKKMIFQLVADNHGSGLVVVLLILAAVTIIGISALNTSNVEVQLTQNDMIYKRNIYRSEAAAREGAQLLENRDSDDLTLSIKYGINQVGSTGDDVKELKHLNVYNKTVNFREKDRWADDCTENCTASQTASVDDQTSFAVVFTQIAEGESLDLAAKSKLHEFSVCGFSSPENGPTFLEIGFKRRF